AGRETEPSRSSPKWHWTQNNRTFQKQPKVALDTKQQNLPEAAQSGTGHRTTEPSRSSPKWHWTQNNRTFQKQPKVALDTEQQNQNMKNQSVEAGSAR